MRWSAGVPVSLSPHISDAFFGRWESKLSSDHLRSRNQPIGVDNTGTIQPTTSQLVVFCQKQKTTFERMRINKEAKPGLTNVGFAEAQLLIQKYTFLQSYINLSVIQHPTPCPPTIMRQNSGVCLSVIKHFSWWVLLPWAWVLLIRTKHFCVGFENTERFKLADLGTGFSMR